MRVSDFDFDLPPKLIAQAPAARRDASKLMLVRAGAGSAAHHTFRELTDLLHPGDLIVLNDTWVIPAKLIGRKVSGGRIELLLLAPAAEDGVTWDCWLRSSRKPGPNAVVEFDAGLRGRILALRADRCTVRFGAESGDVARLLERVGRMPLPPYIKRGDGAPGRSEDRQRYQTVFARSPGAIAAPTAGLHFTAELLGELGRRGVECVPLTLHVGPGTFRPVRVERVEDHTMHAERFVLPAAVASAVERARARGGRVIAVGTTVTRVLEFRARAGGTLEPGSGSCDLFIYPGFRFRVVDALITNFHLPRSTLLMLVAAFAGRRRILAAYREAIELGYRFYSYGDAMLVERA